jgi:hypothetical protein
MVTPAPKSIVVFVDVANVAVSPAPGTGLGFVLQLPLLAQEPSSAPVQMSLLALADRAATSALAAATDSANVRATFLRELEG